MRKRNGANASGHMIGELFTFALFGLFIVLSLLIVVIGVNGYRNVVDTSESTDALRTTLGYVAGKLRSPACADGARVETLDGVTALVLVEQGGDGEALETVIYHYEGTLYETYSYAGALDFEPEYGMRLTDIEGFSMEQVDDRLLAFTATAKDGRAQTLHIALRAEGGDAQ